MIDTKMPPMNATVRELGSARRRPRAATERRVRSRITAPAEPASRGRAWINGREVGGTDPRLRHLAASHD